LALGAALISVGVALPMGVLAGVNYKRLSGTLISAVSLLGIAVPAFWAGLLLATVFAIQWKVFPAGGFVDWSDNPLGSLKSLTLPALSLGLVQAAVLTRYIRSAILDVQREDFLRTARAKGLTRWQALYRHGFRYAAIPVVTILGIQLTGLLVGAIVVENVFVLPGLVIGVAYLVAFNDGWLVLTGSGSIVVLAYFTRRVAFIFRSASASIAQVDSKLEEASTICGANWGTTMWRVTVPLIAPGILAGGILVFATLIGEISATVLLYSAKWKTISIAIYELVLGDELAKASALGTVTIVITLVLVIGASKLVSKNMAEMFR